MWWLHWECSSFLFSKERSISIIYSSLCDIVNSFFINITGTTGTLLCFAMRIIMFKNKMNILSQHSIAFSIRNHVPFCAQKRKFPMFSYKELQQNYHHPAASLWYCCLKVERAERVSRNLLGLICICRLVICGSECGCHHLFSSANNIVKVTLWVGGACMVFPDFPSEITYDQTLLLLQNISWVHFI